MKKLLLLLALSMLIVMSGCKKNKPPTCTIISPKDGAELSITDDIIVNVNAKDPDGSIVTVNVYFDNLQYGAAVTEPYMATIPSAVLTQGKHTIKAVAIDNEAAQTEASITVNIGDGGNETESPNFVTFTSGVIPVSWKTNTWEVDVAMGYDDNYSLRSNNPIASVITNKTINNTGYVEFFTYGSSFDLFIDNVKAQAFSEDQADSWKKWVYTFNKGTHSFRWEVNGAVVYIDAITFAPAALPKLSTAEVTNITSTTATSGGNVTDHGNSLVTARGVCWSTSQNPTINDQKTIDGSGIGNFTSNITGLTSNTNYYVRAYATNEIGTAYGEQLSFTASSSNLAEVTTENVTNITVSTADCGGTVISDGNSSVTARGVCWSTSQNPTINDNKTINGTGTGSFTSKMANLSANTLYYVRAYATNNAGTAYGEQVTLTTKKIAVGEKYQGGIIAYVDNTGVHGLIAAPSDHAYTVKWNNGIPAAYLVTGATGTAIGTGQSNTTKIIDIHGGGQYGTGNYAAYLCHVFELDGYSDWYLPSKNELNELYKNQDIIGGFDSSKGYWSSTEYDYKNAWYQHFSNGFQSERVKDYTDFKFRAIRSF
ncbi:MAG: Ig-like domain-containing protein [Lentimicrobiaceae bacterium]|nr:Ig-like domain-containing protein [Lentimicrobiaceae bacterium]